MLIKKNIWLTLILILAFGLRFVLLSEIPVSLNWDEVSLSYTAYSILKTGSDEWGKFLPIANTQAYGDYPLPMYSYLAIPGIALLGLNEFSARFPSAFFGSLLPLVVYFLMRRIFGRDSFAVLAAFLTAISPWSIMTSRQLLQATPAIFFMSLGVWIFLEGTIRKKYLLLVGTFFLGLSAYTYHNTRILSPFLFFILLVLFRKQIFKTNRVLFSILVIAAIFFLPLIPILTSKEGTARAAWVGILDQGAINKINETRGNLSLPEPLPKLLVNKATYSVQVAVFNYLGYFNPIFLGVKGGSQYQFSVQNLGIVYPIELPFFYLGLISLILNFKKGDKFKNFLLVWLLTAPIPAAITRDSYQVVRSMTMLPGFYLATAFGLGIFLDYLSKRRFIYTKVFLTSFLVVIFFMLGKYFYNYMSDYQRDYSFAWQYGYKQAVEYIKQNQDRYKTVVMTKKYGEPHQFLLFYTAYDPGGYKNDPMLIRYPKSNWFWVDGFSKYRFINDWDIVSELSGGKDILLVTSPDNYPKKAKVLKTINFLNGESAFDIVEL